jgi:hypothetical protein
MLLKSIFSSCNSCFCCENDYLMITFDLKVDYDIVVI